MFSNPSTLQSDVECEINVETGAWIQRDGVNPKGLKAFVGPRRSAAEM
jgi:hypothetical protein